MGGMIDATSFLWKTENAEFWNFNLQELRSREGENNVPDSTRTAFRSGCSR
jgi:hypothetical protein